MVDEFRPFAGNNSGRLSIQPPASNKPDDVYWKADIMSQIAMRDRMQRDNFRPIIEQYERLLREEKTLRTQLARMADMATAASPTGRSASVMDFNAGGGAGGGRAASQSVSVVGGVLNSVASMAGYSAVSASVREKQLEEKVAKLQDELNANYRLSNEHGMTILRLKEAAERDEKLVLQKEDLLQKKQAELEDMVDKSELNKVRQTQLEATVDVLRKEIITLQKELAARQEKVKKLEDENERHVQTILTMKDEQAKLMNQMNDHITNLVKDTKTKAAIQAKDAQNKKEADKKISGDVDYSDKNSILDAVSWQANFDVKVPTVQKRTLYITNGQATTINYNHNGSLMVTGGTDSMVRIWDTRTGTLRGTLRGATQSIMSASFDKNDKMVLATSNDNNARLWSTETSRQLHVLTGHTGKVYGGVFTSDGERIFTAAHDRTIKVWNVSSGYCKGTINTGSLCNYLSLSPTTEMAATAHLDTHVRIWSTKSNELLHDFEEIHTQQSTCAEFSLDGSMLVTNSRDNTLNVIDARIFKVVKTLSGDHKTPFKNGVNWGRAVFSPDGRFVIAGATTGGVFVWNLKTGKIETVLVPEAVTKVATATAAAPVASDALPANAITCVAWNANGRQVASCDNSGKLIFWE